MLPPSPSPRLARIQKIVKPILLASPSMQGITITTWVPDIDYRNFPILNLRRIGGGRNPKRPNRLATAVVEMTAYGKVDLGNTEDIYDCALEALYEAVRKQLATEHGTLHSMSENMGATEFGSPFQDSWRIQGLIRLGYKPPSNTN